MAEKQEEKTRQQARAGKPQAEKKRPIREEEHEIIVRIFGYDIPGSKNLYAGLTRIKGVSWAIANAVCIKLNMQRSKKIGELSKEDISKIENFLRNIDIPDYLKNRRFDFETGKTAHLYGPDLEIAKEFDIKRLKKIKSWRGLRHSLGQPTRGQRTKSHFRRKGQGVGVKRNKK